VTSRSTEQADADVRSVRCAHSQVAGSRQRSRLPHVVGTGTRLRATTALGTVLASPQLQHPLLIKYEIQVSRGSYKYRISLNTRRVFPNAALGSIPSRGMTLFSPPLASKPALGPTLPPIQWGPEAISPGVKRPGREADCSPPSSAKVKNGGAIPSLPHTSS
jgi:hypothetical protein